MIVLMALRIVKKMLKNIQKKYENKHWVYILLKKQA